MWSALGLGSVPTDVVDVVGGDHRAQFRRPVPADELVVALGVVAGGHGLLGGVADVVVDVVDLDVILVIRRGVHDGDGRAEVGEGRFGSGLKLYRQVLLVRLQRTITDGLGDVRAGDQHAVCECGRRAGVADALAWLGAVLGGSIGGELQMAVRQADANEDDGSGEKAAEYNDSALAAAVVRAGALGRRHGVVHENSSRVLAWPFGSTILVGYEIGRKVTKYDVTSDLELI